MTLNIVRVVNGYLLRPDGYSRDPSFESEVYVFNDFESLSTKLKEMLDRNQPAIKQDAK